MKTQLFKVNSQTPPTDILQMAAQAIRAGRLVVFPTETVYGVGADAFNEAAVQKIFTAKNRPHSDPLIIHISQLSQLSQVAVEIPALAYHLAERFWPGPLTFVLKRNPAVPAVVTAGLNTVAVRMPRHKVALALLDQAETGIAAPSANLFTRPSPTAVEHVLQDLDGRVDLILDAGRPDIGLESTVVDLTASTPTILRPGGAPVEALRRAIPNLIVKSPHFDDDQSPALSPGMAVKHYAPRAQVILFDGRDHKAVLRRMQATARELNAAGRLVGLMTTEEESPFFSDLPARQVIIGSRRDLNAVGQNLFARMRELDGTDVDVILIKAIHNQAGLGPAIWDRLVRAAAGKVVEVDDESLVSRL